jgi:hypothetical protein
MPGAKAREKLFASVPSIDTTVDGATACDGFRRMTQLNLFSHRALQRRQHLARFRKNGVSVGFPEQRPKRPRKSYSDPIYSAWHSGSMLLGTSVCTPMGFIAPV